jgi:hypothetical protein
MLCELFRVETRKEIAQLRIFKTQGRMMSFMGVPLMSLLGVAREKCGSNASEKTRGIPIF